MKIPLGQQNLRRTDSMSVPLLASVPLSSSSACCRYIKSRFVRHYKHTTHIHSLHFKNIIEKNVDITCNHVSKPTCGRDHKYRQVRTPSRSLLECQRVHPSGLYQFLQQSLSRYMISFLLNAMSPSQNLTSSQRLGCKATYSSPYFVPLLFYSHSRYKIGVTLIFATLLFALVGPCFQ